MDLSYLCRKMVEDIKGKKIRTCLGYAINIAFETSLKRAVNLYTLVISSIQFLTYLTNRDKTFLSECGISLNSSQYIVNAQKNFGRMYDMHYLNKIKYL